MEADLIRDRRVVGLETRGRVTGLPRPVVVGYVEEPDGSLLVAAQGDATSWALNLLDDPACQVRLGELRYAATAEPLDAADHARAVAGLILRYGTPSEGLGRGPSFRIRRTGVDEVAG
jgi:deazaflavin-dependent oxidoreductase (nitroreductase family)